MGKQKKILLYTFQSITDIVDMLDSILKSSWNTKIFRVLAVGFSITCIAACGYVIKTSYLAAEKTKNDKSLKPSSTTDPETQTPFFTNGSSDESAKVNKDIASSNTHYNIPSLDEKIISLPNLSKAIFENDEKENDSFDKCEKDAVVRVLVTHDCVHITKGFKTILFNQ